MFICPTSSTILIKVTHILSEGWAPSKNKMKRLGCEQEPKEAQTKQELRFRTTTLIPKRQTQHRFQGIGGRNEIKEEESILFFVCPTTLMLADLSIREKKKCGLKKVINCVVTICN